METPSHTGGVNEEIREKQLRRLERDRETRRAGVYAESRGKDKKDADRDGYRHRNDSYGDRERQKYEKGERSSRRSQNYNGDKRDEFREPRSRRSEWEETPYRSSKSTRDESYTPRHKSKGMIILCLASSAEYAVTSKLYPIKGCSIILISVPPCWGRMEFLMGMTCCKN